MFTPFFLYAGLALLALYIPLATWGSRRMAKKQPWDGFKALPMLPADIVGSLMVVSFLSFIHWAILPVILLMGAVCLLLVITGNF